MEFCGVAVSFGEFGDMHVVVFVQDVAYNFVSSGMFVVFAVVVNCRFVIAAVCFVKSSSFVIVIR